MTACGISDQRMRRVISEAIEQDARSKFCTAEEIAGETAATMIENFAEYKRCGSMSLLRYTWSPRKFFAHGHWKNWQLWPIDRAREALIVEAGAGCQKM